MEGLGGSLKSVAQRYAWSPKSFRVLLCGRMVFSHGDSFSDSSSVETKHERSALLPTLCGHLRPTSSVVCHTSHSEYTTGFHIGDLFSCLVFSRCHQLGNIPEGEILGSAGRTPLSVYPKPRSLADLESRQLAFSESCGM